MTWLKLDDGFAEHPKVEELSDGAFRAHIRAMCWSARRETDGRLTQRVASSIAKKRQRNELVSVGLWEADGDEYVIHDFLKYNPSRATLELKRDVTKRRVESLRERRRNATGNAVTTVGGNAGGNGGCNTCPDPGPDPDHSPSGECSARAPDLTDSESESLCPLDLLNRAKAAGVIEELAKGLKQPAASVEHEVREFVTYWTIGGGKGQRRRHWMTKLRRNVCKRAEGGHMVAPGAIAHNGGRRDGGDPDWPTARDVELRTQIAAGQWGERLAKLLNAGRLDASLARREVAEVKQARAERARVQS